MKENDLTVHISIFLTFSWQDNRLNFTSNTAARAEVDKQFLDKIWMPDIYIYNMKEMEEFNGAATMRGLNVQKHGDSVKLLYSMEANVKFQCAQTTGQRCVYTVVQIKEERCVDVPRKSSI